MARHFFWRTPLGVSGASLSIVRLVMVGAIVTVTGTTVALGGSVAVGASADRAKVSAADPVIVRVNGAAIYRSDMNNAYDQLPAALRALPKDKVRRILIKSLIDTKLVSMAARAQGLDKTEAFKQRRAHVLEQILERMYLAKVIDARVDADALHKNYRDFVKKFSGRKEMRVRHILVKTRKKAYEIVSQLDKGADFANLARKFSLDSTASKGGELGFFPPQGVAKPFADAAAALKVGTYTHTPVHTSYGWHVILLEGRRPQKPPSFAHVRGRLDRELSREAADTLIQNLRRKAKIELVGWPVAAAPGFSSQTKR